MTNESNGSVNDDEFTINSWIDDLLNGVGGWYSFETHEMPMHHISRDHSIVDWVIRTLANPRAEGSQQMVDAIVARREEMKAK